VIDLTLLFQLGFGAPETIDAVFERLGRTQLAAIGGKRVSAKISERLDRDSPVSASGISTLKSAAAGVAAAILSAAPGRNIPM